MEVDLNTIWQALLSMASLGFLAIGGVFIAEIKENGFKDGTKEALKTIKADALPWIGRYCWKQRSGDK